MSSHLKKLEMRFDGNMDNRGEFLRQIRTSITEFTGERMTLDALINEIAKNIFDHAHGLGYLVIKLIDGSFEFEIKDYGQESYDFEYCSSHSRLVGNGVNFGIGLKEIRALAQVLGVNLQIDSSQGFSYSGVYVPQRHVD